MWRKKPNEKNELLCDKCYKCLYYGMTTDICDYYLITEIRNPCKAKNCKKYTRRYGNKTGHHGFYTACMILYNKGLNDLEIAEKLKCSPITIAKWRNERNLLFQKSERKEK